MLVCECEYEYDCESECVSVGESVSANLFLAKFALSNLAFPTSQHRF